MSHSDFGAWVSRLMFGCWEIRALPDECGRAVAGWRAFLCRLIRGGRDGVGLTALELMFTVAIAATLMAIAVPLTGNTLDEIRTASAARYVEGRIMSARFEALKRSRAVGLQFQQWEGDYLYASYADGNANGIRTADIENAVDSPLVQPERLGDKFPTVRFELMPEVPDIDGNTGGALDGVRIGTARILTLSPDGTATSGTLYLRGRRAQYAVRVLGVTGRTRMLQYRPGEGVWVSR